jgi:hypothetical protein
MVDFAAAALACRRANAAYIEDAAQSKAAFSALGDAWIDMITGIDYQAVLSADAAGATHLSISGTRASQGALFDVLDDADLAAVQVPSGSVTAGVNGGQDKMWAWVEKTVDPRAVISIAGHSLGAARTALSVAYLAPERIGALHSFESPKFLSAEFYAAHAAVISRMVCMLNGRDTWAAFPWVSETWQARPPQDHVWLTASGFQMIDPKHWIGAGSFEDHDIYPIVQRLQNLAHTQKQTFA